MPTSSSFVTSMITYLNRIIIIDKDFFMNEILTHLNKEQGMTFQQFVGSWIKKMDMITSRESLRINLIAIYMLIPHFNTDLLALFFGELGRHTFSQLDTYMYLKLTNSSCRFHSPSKVSKDNCTFPYGGSGLLQ